MIDELIFAQDLEAKAMDFLSRPEMQADPTIRIPKLLRYDQENHILTMEDAGPLPSLKTWTTEAVDVAACTQIGEALGRFLAHVHNATYHHDEVLTKFTGNETAKYLSGTLYFGGLPKAAETFGYTNPYLAEAAKVGEEEVMQSSEVLTMGDFWTGNILVSAPTAERDLHLYALDLELCKPGTAEFDLGQMAAEMWCLSAFRKGARGQSLALLEAFLGSYKATRTVPVDAAKVAVRIGAHLFVIMPMAWSSEASPEQVSAAAEEGREFVRMGWEKDEEALRKSVVNPLM